MIAITSTTTTVSTASIIIKPSFINIYNSSQRERHTLWVRIMCLLGHFFYCAFFSRLPSSSSSSSSSFLFLQPD